MKDNKLPEVVDLFSGCGGLALGFQRAGFKITHGVELVQSAADTASYNLHWRYGEESQHLCGDITKLDPDIFSDKIGSNGCIVIGGPPCQAYSLAGRAKLKSLGEARINTNDKRGYLYQDFLRFALGLKARAIVMENVPESVNYGGKNIPQTVCEILEENGYKAIWTILNSADYGVPQLRERVIVMAINSAEKLDIKMPVPSNRSMEGKITQNQLRFRSLAEFTNFREPLQGGDGCKPWVTVGDAFSDLPSLMPSLECKYKLNKITAGLPYDNDIEADYQRTMRTWYGRVMESVTGNCYRKTLRDYPIFAQMEQGDNYVEASMIADKLFATACDARNLTMEADEEAYLKLKKEIVQIGRAHV